MQILKVYQIYYKPEQQALLEPEYVPYLNENCTPYFESSVISSLVSDCAHLQSEYFGVVSYKLREKIGSVMKERWKSIPEIANSSGAGFTPGKFEAILRAQNPDAMSFQQHLPHDPIRVAERFHPDFQWYWEKIMREIGFTWKPTHLEHVFYCNYFVAKREIYDSFVTDMLNPAIKVMDMMPELWKDSGYPHKIPVELAAKWGIVHYPFQSFLCERMFSWYAHVTNLNCMNF